MKRILGSLLIAGLMFSASACGGGGNANASTTKGATKTSTTDSSNADVKSYCDAVDVYIKEVKGAMNDPAKAQAISAKAAELAKKAQALATADLSADDAKAMGDCTKHSAEALTPPS
ncbi:MAG: hypothetical protein ABIP03_14305 [Aquihabitans sp.]